MTEYLIKGRGKINRVPPAGGAVGYSSVSTTGAGQVEPLTAVAIGAGQMAIIHWDVSAGGSDISVTCSVTTISGGSPSGLLMDFSVATAGNVASGGGHLGGPFDTGGVYQIDLTVTGGGWEDAHLWVIVLELGEIEFITGG